MKNKSKTFFSYILFTVIYVGLYALFFWIAFTSNDGALEDDGEPVVDVSVQYGGR